MQVAVLLYDRFTALDAIGPYEVFGQLPGVELHFVALETGIIRSDTGALGVVIDRTVDQVQPDIVVVPGGPGSMAAAALAGHQEWLRGVGETATWLTSVCTGSELLAAAGLLQGCNATTHWTRTERLASLGAIPVSERVVRNGKIVTGAGVSAGIDMALQVVSWQFGEVVAQAIQLGIEYDPAPPFAYDQIPDVARQIVLSAMT